MAASLLPQAQEANLSQELKRLRWSQHQLACASQLRPEVVSRLMTGKVAIPYAQTRKKILMALRRRAEELRIAAPNEVELFSIAGKPVLYQEQWQAALVTYARRINTARRLTDELEPLWMLRLRFELARQEEALGASGTLEQWEHAADIVYYAAQRAAQGEPEALEEAQRILSLGRLSWEKAIVAALARYVVRSSRIGKETEYEWQALVCSLQAFDRNQRG